MVRREEGEVVPNNINNWAGVSGARGSVGEGKISENCRFNSKLNYQERVAMIWTEKLKAMGS